MTCKPYSQKTKLPTPAINNYRKCHFPTHDSLYLTTTRPGQSIIIATYPTFTGIDIEQFHSTEVRYYITTLDENNHRTLHHEKAVALIDSIPTREAC